MKTIIAVLFAAAFMGGGLTAVVWFNANHVSWFIDDIQDPVAFKEQWQEVVDASAVKHPAVLHYLPDDCLCKLFTLKHAKDVTNRAVNSGFNVYQYNSTDTGLGKQLTSLEITVNRPVIAITDDKGRLAYLGAYSDGIRCNEGNSMVSAFVSKPDSLPEHTVLGLDVEGCRCH